jgi:hypothetical protein
MRTGTRRLLGVVLTALSLVGTVACGAAPPAAAPIPTGPVGSATPAGEGASAGPGAAGATSGAAPSAGSPITKGPTAACDAVKRARDTAAQVLAPVTAVLARSGLSRDDLAKATNDLQTTYTAMHVSVAGAAELTDDPRLKAEIAAYQLAVELAIVAVEGSDGEQAKLAAITGMPELQAAQKALEASCG